MRIKNRVIPLILGLTLTLNSVLPYTTIATSTDSKYFIETVKDSDPNSWRQDIPNHDYSGIEEYLNDNDIEFVIGSIFNSMRPWSTETNASKVNLDTCMYETGGLLFALSKLIYYSGADNNINPGKLYYRSFLELNSDGRYYMDYYNSPINTSYDYWAEFIKNAFPGLTYTEKVSTATSSGESSEEYTQKIIKSAIDSNQYIIIEIPKEKVAYYNWGTQEVGIGTTSNHFMFVTGYEETESEFKVKIDDSLSNLTELDPVYSVTDICAVHKFTAEGLTSNLDSYRGEVEIPWNLILVNKENPVDEDYIENIKTGLVNVGVVPGATGNKYARNEVDERVVSDMESMANAYQAETGDKIYCQSGMRSYAYQDSLYKNNVAANGQTHADMYSARPGHSEHNVGLAMDFGAYTSGGSYVSTETTFENTKAFEWMCQHAHEYGFILRYLKGDIAVASTGYGYEPWHWRYIGKDYAMKFIEYVGADKNSDGTVLAYVNNNYNNKTYEDFYKEIVVPEHTTNKPGSTSASNSDAPGASGGTDNTLYSDEAPRRLYYFLRHPVSSLANFFVGMFQRVYSYVAVGETGSVSSSSWMLSIILSTNILKYYLILTTIMIITCIIVIYIRKLYNRTSSTIYNTGVVGIMKLFGITIIPVLFLVASSNCINLAVQSVLNNYQDILLMNDFSYSITAEKLKAKEEEESKKSQNNSNNSSGDSSNITDSEAIITTEPINTDIVVTDENGVPIETGVTGITEAPPEATVDTTTSDINTDPNTNNTNNSNDTYEYWNDPNLTLEENECPGEITNEVTKPGFSTTIDDYSGYHTNTNENNTNSEQVISPVQTPADNITPTPTNTLSCTNATLSMRFLNDIITMTNTEAQTTEASTETTESTITNNSNMNGNDDGHKRFRSYNGGTLDVNMFTDAIGTVAAAYCDINPSYKSGGLHYEYHIEGKSYTLDSCCTTLVNLTFKMLGLNKIYGNSVMYGDPNGNLRKELEAIGFKYKRVSEMTNEEWAKLSPGTIFVCDGSNGGYRHVEVFMGWITDQNNSKAYCYDSGKGCLGAPPERKSRKSYSSWTDGCTYVEPMTDSGWSQSYASKWYTAVYFPSGVYDPNATISTETKEETSSSSNSSADFGDSKVWTDEELEKDIFLEQFVNEYSPILLTFSDGSNEVKMSMKQFYDSLQDPYKNLNHTQVTLNDPGQQSTNYYEIKITSPYSMNDVNVQTCATPNNYVLYNNKQFIPVNYSKYGENIYYYFYDYIKYQYIRYNFINDKNSFYQFYTEPKDLSFDVQNLISLTQDKYNIAVLSNDPNTPVADPNSALTVTYGDESYEQYITRIKYADSQIKNSYYNLTSMYGDYNYVYNNGSLSDMFGLSYLFNITDNNTADNQHYAVPNSNFIYAESLEAWGAVERANYHNLYPNYEDYSGYNFNSPVLPAIMAGTNWEYYRGNLSKNYAQKDSYYFSPKSLGYTEYKQYNKNEIGMVPYRLYVSNSAFNYVNNNHREYSKFEIKLQTINENIYDRISKIMKYYTGELNDDQMICLFSVIATEEFNKMFSDNIQPQEIDPGNIDVDKLLRISYSSSLEDMYKYPDTMYLIYRQNYGLLNCIFIFLMSLFLFVNNAARACVIVLIFITTLLNSILYSFINKEIRVKTITTAIIQLIGVIIDYLAIVFILCINLNLQTQYRDSLLSPVITLFMLLLVACVSVIMVLLLLAYVRDVTNFGALKIGTYVDYTKKVFKDNLNSIKTKALKGVGEASGMFVNKSKTEVKNTRRKGVISRYKNLQESISNLNKRLGFTDNDEDEEEDNE